MSELIIDENNFNEYFFDVRMNKPKKGQVLACYEHMAELVDGDLKRDVLNLLLYNDNAAISSPRLLQKLACASYVSSYDVVENMVKDLLEGMKNEDILEKSYPFILQMHFWTKKEYIPDDDPHWSTIQIVKGLENYDGQV